MNIVYKTQQAIRMFLFLSLFFTPAASYATTSLEVTTTPKNPFPYNLFFFIDPNGIGFTMCNDATCTNHVKNTYFDKGRTKIELKNICALSEGTGQYIYDNNNLILAVRNIYTVQKVINNKKITFKLIPYHVVSMILNENVSNDYMNKLKAKKGIYSHSQSYKLFFRRNKSHSETVPSEAINLKATSSTNTFSKCLLSSQGKKLSVAISDENQKINLENFTITMTNSSTDAPYPDQFQVEKKNP